MAAHFRIVRRSVDGAALDKQGGDHYKSDGHGHDGPPVFLKEGNGGIVNPCGESDQFEVPF